MSVKTINNRIAKASVRVASEMLELERSAAKCKMRVKWHQSDLISHERIEESMVLSFTMRYDLEPED